MPTYKNFEDTPAWQAASSLYNQVLDLFEQNSGLFSSGFRNQLDRAALSVSNNIAEGFERVSTRELANFLGIARGSAGEVRSMCRVVYRRVRSGAVRVALDAMGEQAMVCVKQLTAWMGWMEQSGIQGKRHMTPEVKTRRKMEAAAMEYRRKFFTGMASSHPLYNTREAKIARGEIPAEE